MNVSTISMDPTEAQKMVDAYRAAITERTDETDRVLLRGYKQLAVGNRLIDIVNVFRDLTDYDAECRPRLAFARATAKWCEWTRHGDANGRFLDLPRAKGKRALYEFQSVFRSHEALGYPRMPSRYWWKAKARVPLIPLHLRPESLVNYHILFEAEWDPIPPKDPILLKRLHDNIFVVVAEWNLTELERAVIHGLMRKEVI